MCSVLRMGMDPGSCPLAPAHLRGTGPVFWSCLSPCAHCSLASLWRPWEEGRVTLEGLVHFLVLPMIPQVCKAAAAVMSVFTI